MKKLIERVPVLYPLAKRLRFRYRALKGSFQLRRRLKSATVLKVVVGAGGVFDEGWIPTEVEYLNLVNARHWEKYFRPNSLDAILAEHVWEHLTAEEAVMAARHCYEYLKGGGVSTGGGSRWFPSRSAIHRMGQSGRHRFGRPQSQDAVHL